ncbi:thioredoxin domain-containing protein 11 [Fopius arisanus]|uniref:Thioredoxin domain-containing protein 11 n=1 Tax=Fopius arisanus TaxID=64838 RepID=A0A9R1U7N0_9HYME|nr:PREDICTED: thioredoxin domain-containing protein 11 [Fopius arisanus]
MMLNEGKDESTRNVDYQNSPSDTESCNVASESPRNPSLEERIASKMLSYSRETICLFIGIFTFGIAFAALHTAAPRVSKPPLARPFFNENSMVIDFYKGQVSAMIERVSDSDFCFVMYYAPWDAQSQAVREEFEIVARQYHSQVFFSAINCWHPGSECRAQYPKIRSYPLLILYPLRGTGVQYKSVPTAPYMLAFLRSYLHPLTRISTEEDLQELLPHPVFVGFFNFSSLSMSPGYQEFYRASVRSLELDPNREVKFAVATSPLSISPSPLPSVSFYLWNETLIYPSTSPWTSDSLLQWLEASIHRVSAWLQPPGTKSLTLAPHLSSGPVILMFTPRNPLHPSNYNYNLLQEVALEYHDCESLWWTQKLIDKLRKERQTSKKNYLEMIQRCAELSNSNESPIPLSISLQRWVNDSCCAKIFMNKCLLCKRSLEHSGGVCNSPESLQDICSQKDVFRVRNEGDFEKNLCCDDDPRESAASAASSGAPGGARKFSSSIITGEDDPRSPENVRKRLAEESCKFLLLGNKYQPPIFPVVLEGDERRLEAACTTNKSLTFLAIDSLRYFHFAEALGIDLLRIQDKTAVVILDSAQESQYLLEGPLGRAVLVRFVQEFNNATLKRNLRSDSSRRYARDFQPVYQCREQPQDQVCVQELTTENFLGVVMDPERDVVVFYHSPYCAFCGAVSYVFLTVARYLKGMSNLAFVRIDGDNNDLPWEYSMNRYPAVLFFPAKRKEDSTVYPFTLPITIPNLLNFVLANLNDDSHIEALVNVCHTGAGEPPKDCVARIRRLCLDIIHNQLAIYRKLRRQRQYLSKMTISNKRREISRRLELVREIHLILSSVDDLETDLEKFSKILQKFRAYRRPKKIASETCEISRGEARDKRRIGSLRDEL